MVEGEFMESVYLTIFTGEFPRDAWLTVEVCKDFVRVEEAQEAFYDGECDWAPALEWAAGCTLEEVPPLPAGWKLQTCDVVAERAKMLGWCVA